MLHQVLLGLLLAVASSVPALNVTSWHHEGYAFVENVLDAAQVDYMREQTLALQRAGYGLTSAGGASIADFLEMPEFKFLADLPHHPKLLAALRDVFGDDNFRFCGHNDIGIDRLVGWHKDKLNNEYERFQISPLWLPLAQRTAVIAKARRRGVDVERALADAEGHFIVKAAFYLQDHT